MAFTIPLHSLQLGLDDNNSLHVVKMNRFSVQETLWFIHPYQFYLLTICENVEWIF